MIEQLAKILTPAPEMAVLIGVTNEDVFLLDIATKGHPARAAYMRGMASTARELRERNLELAKACAPSAIEQCFKDLRQMLQDL